MSFLSRLPAIAAALLLGACAAEDLNKPQTPVGDFRLGYNIVVAKNAEAVGPSRKATPEEWEAAIKTEIARRTGTYQGSKLYHIGVGVEAYALAVPGIPVVLAPKSALVVTVNVWDDTAGVIVNPKPKQLMIIEAFSDKSVIGSGLTKTREEQIQGLAEQAARRINAWLVENKVWFTPQEVAKRAAAKTGTAPPAVPATAVPPAAVVAAPVVAAPAVAPVVVQAPVRPVGKAPPYPVTN